MPSLTDPSASSYRARLAYIALNLLPLHPAGLRRLLEIDPDPAAALEGACDRGLMVALLARRGAAPPPPPEPCDAPGRLDLLAGTRLGAGGMRGLAEREEERARGRGIGLVTLADDEYPALLREIPDPPPALYAWGALEPDDEVRVAVVGSRRATRHGLGAAELIAARLAEAGIVVVSGLARGIDAAAHRAALDSGRRTIGVLGSGLERLYPPEHRELADRIAARGAVISEYPLDMPPLPQLFPRRNRIISGLSAATVVVEAGAASGALVTARFALEQDRELFAVPGTILGEACAGSNALLVEAIAHAATCARDVLRQLPAVFRLRLGLPASAHDEPAGEPAALPFDGDAGADVTAGRAREGSALSPAAAASLGPEAEAIARLLSFDEPVGIDGIVEASGVPAPEVLAAVARLELLGIAVTLPGGRVARARPDPV